jgi:hypothetical protein
MDVRKIIKEEIKKALLSEGHGFSPIPKTFDHLKWDFTPNQKHYLQRLCEEGYNSLAESDYKSASRFLGITETNVKSILNTYGSNGTTRSSQHGGDSQAAMNSRLTFGNKPATAVDIGLTPEVSRLPVKSSTQMNTNDRGMTHNEMSSNIYSEFKNRVMYKDGSGKEHPSKSRERFFEGLNKSLMMYLYCEANPEDINLRNDNNKIQLDFDSVIEENKFNQLDGGSNYEDEKYKFINNLLESFNEKFNCSYIICEHIKTDGGVRIVIEHNVTMQIDMSKDSMHMMKGFLLKKVITGHKIEQENSHIASLMGLDAGDTTWLYGPTGQAPQSGILTKNR